jgi:hypothetical protein
MTVEYSDSAKTRVEEYLRAVRDRLKASESVDAQEVVNDLRGHIERELSGLSQPVSEADVNKVLDRLGPPEQVVDEGDMSWWRKMILHLRRGPEDWRLAYLSLGVLIGSIFLARAGILLGIIASFLLSRAALAVAREPDPPAKKWLIYPSLIIVYSLIAFFGLLWPALAGGGCIGDTIGRRGSALYKSPLFDSDGLGTVLVILSGGAMALAAWWSLLWRLGRRHPSLVRVLFRPFADHWTGRLFGKVVLGVWAISIVLIAITVLLWIST